MTGWRVEQRRGEAAALHGRDALENPARTVTVLEVTEPAIVLGSTQRDDVLLAPDHPRRRGAPIAVARRRTGGGAVYLAPGRQVWVDVTIPVGDPLWRDDVAAAFAWVGQAWSRALAELGVHGGTVNDAAVCHSALGRLVCFAGLGSGEVASEDGKIVGIAQRRTRSGAWFQCTVPRVWDTGPYLRYLEPGLRRATDDPRRALAEVRVRPVDAPAVDVVEAFLAQLPA